MLSRPQAFALATVASAVLHGCKFDPPADVLPDAGDLDAPMITADGPDEDGALNVTWDLRSTNAQRDEISAPCPAGATHAVIFSLPTGGSTPYEDRWPCGDGAGTASDLPAGEYQVWVRLSDGSGQTRYAESESRTVTVTAGGTATVPPFRIFVDRGFYRVGWTLRNAGGTAVTCGSVAGLTQVSILATGAGANAWETLVPCAQGLAPALAITVPMPSELTAGGAQYAIAIDLLNAQGQSIASATPIAPSPARALDYGNEIEDLGFVEITVP